MKINTLTKRLTALLLAAALLISDIPPALAASTGTNTGTQTAATSAIPFATKTKDKYTGKKYTHASRFKGTEILHGVDVSKYQGFGINWKKVKADGIDFAFLRIGHSWWASAANGNIRLGGDESFETNYRNARAAGVATGVYYYSQAINVEEAHKEAAYVLKMLRHRSLEMPVVFDSEGPDGSRLAKAKVSKTEMTAIAQAFCEDIEAGGYEAMVYGGLKKFTDKLAVSTLVEKYGLWFARYNINTYYDGPYTMWQYADDGKVSGISGKVDMTFWYKPVTEALNAPVLATGQVAGLTVKQTGTKSLNVSFNAQSGVRGYEIWRGEAYDGVYEKIADTTDTSYADTDLLPGREYYYQVRAVSGTAEQPQYHEFSEIVGQHTANTASLTIRTTVSTTLRAHAGSAYSKVASLSSGTRCTLIAITREVDSTAWYHVKVTVNGVEKEGYISSASAAFPLDQVTGLKLKTRTSKTITLSWNKQTGIDGYRIYIADARNGSSRLLTTVGAGATTCKITGLSKYTQYFFRVKSFIRILEADQQEEEQMGEGTASKMLAAETKHKTIKLKTKAAVYLRKYAGTSYRKVKLISKKKKLTADYRTKDKKGKWWYHVKVKIKGKTYKGFVPSSAVKKR